MTDLFADEMKDWDEEKLRSVVTAQEGKQKTTTDVSSNCGIRKLVSDLQIVCKFFIQAVEDQKYGWL